MPERCEDFPACGHTDGPSCQPIDEGTSDHWLRVFEARERAGYDFDDPIFDEDVQ